MRDILLSIHIIGAAAFIGGGAYSLAVFPGNVKEIGIKAALARDEAMGNKFFGTAVGILLLSGILLVLDSDVYGWGDAFVLIGIGVIVLSGAIEGLYVTPMVKRLSASGDDSPAAIKRFIWQAGSPSMLLLLFALFVMVSKLGT